MHPQVRRAGQLGAFALVAAIAYQFIMFAAVGPILFGATLEVLDDPVRNMQSTAANRLLVVAVYAAVFVEAFALALLLQALQEIHRERQPALADLAWFAGAIGSVAGLVEASSVIVGIPTLAGWYARDPAAAVAGMVTQQAISNGLHMLNFVSWGAAILLASLAALREHTVPRGIAGYGVIAGLVGVGTILILEPFFFVLLAFVPWFAAIGWKLRTSTDA